MTNAVMSPAAEAIAAANATFVAAFDRGDVAAVAGCYTENGAVLPPNAETIEGRAGIQAFWQGVMNMGVTGVTLTSVEVEDQGAITVEVGRYTLSGAAGQSLDAGKYMVLWKHDRGEWRLHRDIWNSSRPAAG